MDNDAKDFEGRTLDEAIREACDYYGEPREKLEIEILQDAKSGIFGLVGSRKATVRARRAQVARVEEILGGAQQRKRGTKPSQEENAKADEHHDSKSRKPRQPRKQQESKASGDAPKYGVKPAREQKEQAKRPKKKDVSPKSLETSPLDADLDHEEHPHERLPYTPLDTLDQVLLRDTVMEAADRLIRPIAGDAALDLEIADGRVAVHISSEEDLGLLIGREGQTLASLQYLASRIVARRMGSPVRIQLDAGDYRERQDDKLRELALVLAERAKTTGRTCPTRPLSSYQRRIVHMALQDDPEIQTRSSGEGPLKRVVIQRARSEQ